MSNTKAVSALLVKSTEVDSADAAPTDLGVEKDHDAVIASMIAKGFDSKVWHDAKDVRSAFRSHFSLTNAR